MYEVVHPAGWGYKAPSAASDKVLRETLGLSGNELQERVRQSVRSFLDKLYDEEEGALRHYYRADNKTFGEKDSGNFLMALNFLTVYDMDKDEELLRRAENCYLWAYRNTTEIHPMFTWQGGVRDGFKPDELYVKYTGDAFLTANALYRRTKKEEYLFHIKQYHNFFKQARKAGFKYKYDKDTHTWHEKGFVWRAFGYPVSAYLELHELTGEKRYLDEALLWGEHALTLQHEDGGFYLLDGEFWNSDLAPVELRALIYLYEATKDGRYLESARRFADWLLEKQRDDGAWPIGIDKEGEVVAPNVGPGDMPNIAMSLLRLLHHVDDEKYFEAAKKAVRYGLSMQAVEDGKYPFHLDDPCVKWGFWSWEPLHDHSLSGDQSVHHIRGILFFAHHVATRSR